MPVASAAQLDHMAATYQNILSRMAAVNEIAMEQAWKAQSGTGRAAAREFADVIAPRVSGAARESAARMSSAFFDAYMEAATGRTAPALADIEAILENMRGGVGNRRLYADLVKRAGQIEFDTGSLAVALNETSPALGVIADSDVILASQQSTVEAAQRWGVRQFKRRPEPSACSFCQTVAQPVYRRPDLAPVHGHCHCIVVPVAGNTTVGPTTPPEDAPTRGLHRVLESTLG